MIKKMINTGVYGIASSGKTTVLKQLDLFYNDGQNLKTISKNNIINNIRQNCIDNIISLCKISNDQQCIQMLNKLSIDIPTDLHLISILILSVWKRPIIKTKYATRHWYSIEGHKIDDNMQYFFDKIQQIMDIKYIPNCDDVIRYKTINNSDIEMVISNNVRKFKMREFRDFESISCQLIIFCAALSDYCVYNESTKRQSMHDSIDLFQRIVKSNMGKKSNIVLLFNKIDIFKQCLRKGISLRNCFGLQWKGHDYNSKLLPIYARLMAMNFEKNVKNIIPDPVIQIIQKYLAVDTNMSDEQYFDLCYKEATDFIESKYLDKLKHTHHGSYYSQLFNATDYDWIEDVICNSAVYQL